MSKYIDEHGEYVNKSKSEGSWFFSIVGAAVGWTFVGGITLLIAIGFIMIGSVVSGCGTFNIDAPIDSGTSESTEVEPETTEAEPETETPEEPEVVEETKAGPKPPGVVEEIKEPVEIENDTQEDTDKPDYIYYPAKVTWPEAFDNAPEGYTLASRVELIELVDLGLADDVLEEGVWSATEYETVAGMFWIVTTEYDFAAMETLAFPALYVAQSDKVILFGFDR